MIVYRVYSMGWERLPKFQTNSYPRNEDMLNLIEHRVPGCSQFQGISSFCCPIQITSLFWVCMRQNYQAPKMDDLMLEIAIVSWVWLGPYPYVRIKIRMQTRILAIS